MKEMQQKVIMLFSGIGLMLVPLFSSCDSKSERNVRVSSSSSEESVGEVFTSEGHTDEVQLKKPHFKVFVENSGSMYGYVKGATKFEQAIYSYISDIQLKDQVDSLSLNYINSKIIPQTNDLSKFILELEPSTFRSKGGMHSTTDISKLCEMVFKSTNESTVSLLVSDFIFSPGKNDAGSYLVNQQIAIKSHVANHLKANPNHGLAVLQLSSQFDGYFYDRKDTPIKYRGERPYYMWLVGDKSYIKSLTQKDCLRAIKGDGVKNIYSVTKELANINYAVKVGSGDFDLDRSNVKQSVRNLSKNSRSGQATFSVDADFSELLCDKEYLIDDNNYELSDPDYKLEIIENRAGNGYTHTLKFRTSIIKPSILTVNLKSKLPLWVSDLNDEDGIAINDDNKFKTYGLNNLIEGLYEGVTINSDKYAEIKININN